MAIAAPFPTVRVRPAQGRSATRPCRRSSTRPAVRLTRRGRIAAFLGASALLTGVVLGAGQAAQAGPAASAVTGPATALVVVQPGETLWSIAQHLAPQADPRATVQRIRELNGLGSAVVVPGQPLVVPAG